VRRALALPLLLSFAWCTGCEPPPSTGPNAVRASTYAVELKACVATASTLAESQACRCRVNRSEGRPCTPETDGGSDGAQ
jgi:hypothetical protein